MQRPLIGVTCGTVSQPGELRRLGTNAEYVAALQAAGADVVMIPPAGVGSVARFAEIIDGLLLPGGTDVDPARYGQERQPGTDQPDVERDALEIAMTHAAMARGVPVLAICRGQQLLNVALGGTLVQDLEDGPHRLPPGEPRDRPRHVVSAVPGSALHRAAGSLEVEVNSRHHQAIAAVAPSLLVTARGADGVVEGVESADGAVVGVQCHPESMPIGEGWQQRLFEDFVARARARRSTPG